MEHAQVKTRTVEAAAAGQAGKRTAGARRKNSEKLQIPALYAVPMGDRDFQGCLKARA